MRQGACTPTRQPWAAGDQQLPFQLKQGPPSLPVHITPIYIELGHLLHTLCPEGV